MYFISFQKTTKTIIDQKIIADYDHSISDLKPMLPARRVTRSAAESTARTVAAFPLDADGPASSVATKAG
ncbi:MAG: hypothetical protein Q8R85_18405 [Bosea sp. (in: a-proteobacteria)]|uniref:hypothetical protein n=1 Tax=Bosea sp. (in: a-proteobacteria) TaxID=1871050 RepID=UPI002734400B|nr:hypothetical protein [Bosea sp. (in: a-proteobacteria)]MDP3603137.1 hypothetical protein [Bosea sp. (in: a-proteobacteria)]